MQAMAILMIFAEEMFPLQEATPRGGMATLTYAWWHTERRMSMHHARWHILVRLHYCWTSTQGK
jgi:hypothetical protein